MDRDEIIDRFVQPPSERSLELERIEQEKIARGEVLKSVPYDPTQAIGLDDNYDPFPDSGEESSTERTDTP
ncbi:hypothetical protein CEP50_11110 [Actinopolyspora mortivallis]|uniref:Uncharacterized protein n=2 Tax=Actinopolyspora mortivallis TaxID=33906 RepID=A0A2T0GW85_ACTMO|nr:hypothetical protein CEP50_11110 [Actinopolyspora mortivallis]